MLGVVKFWEPVLGKKPIAVEVPVGSNHEAFIDFEKFAILTESVVETGVYTMARESLEDQAFVA